MAWRLQEEEKGVEWAQRGEEAATLALMREAAGLLTWAKWRACRDPPRRLGQASCLWLWWSSHQW